MLARVVLVRSATRSTIVTHPMRRMSTVEKKKETDDGCCNETVEKTRMLREESKQRSTSSVVSPLSSSPKDLEYCQALVRYIHHPTFIHIKLIEDWRNKQGQ